MRNIKQRHIVWVLLWIAIPIFAQENSRIYRAVYDLKEIYTYKGDKWEPDLSDEKSDIKSRKDIIRLELHPESSFCYSYHTWMTDSLEMEPNGEKIWYEMFFSWYRGNRTGAENGDQGYPHKRSTWQIVKNHSDDMMKVFDCFDQQDYQYADSLLMPQNWVITDSISNINGYDCQLATCSYHGREWQAWFSTELPWHDGPWKLSGLPGLIVSASDAQGFYQFNLKDIYPISSPLKPWAKKPKKTTREKFLKENFEYLKQLDGGGITAQFGIKVDQSRQTPRRYRPGIEKDYDYK